MQKTDRHLVQSLYGRAHACRVLAQRVVDAREKGWEAAAAAWIQRANLYVWHAQRIWFDLQRGEYFEPWWVESYEMTGAL